ncbi:SpoIIE family protein phosphatase [Actinomarinicola tropica]|uniref:SpoIIE family protein phosphatase n=1 Tax=Actinomarinicola tropica TaxID=2789776 RepID=A0A5Q2RPI7_9ACTN|nr:SpoIIE family protein phosphatase [Actinomarinicola tropica]QGG96027.1 SpoIIE family protein phosphatase [Actinomarinicola tropica]
MEWRRYVDPDRPATQAIAVGLAYAALATSSFALFGASEIGVTFFPPAGLTFAVLLATPRRRWPPILVAIVVAEVTVDLANGYSLEAALGWATANVVEPTVGAWLASRISAPAIGRRFALAILVGGILVGPAAGASIGAATLSLFEGGDGWAALSDIWVGDALGVLIVAPLVLAVLRPATFTSVAVTWLDLAGTTGVAVVATVVVVGVGDPRLGYAAALALALPAARYGTRELAIAAVIFASVLTTATAHDVGPWAPGRTGADPQERLVEQQAFILLATAAAWFVKLEVTERVRAATIATAARADLREARRAALDREHLAAMNVALADLGSVDTLDALHEALPRHARSICDCSSVQLDLDVSARAVESTARPPRIALEGQRLVVPLRTPTASGSLVLERPGPRPWSGGDQIRAVAFASIVGDGIERVMRAETHRHIGLTFQDAIRPRVIGDDLGQIAHGLYRPATSGMYVGGDWYDVVVVEDGSELLTSIGDVAGHDLAAAAQMGRVASSARALAHAGHPPAEQLELLDELALQDEEALMATVVCARIDLKEGEMVYASAGHLPPMLRRAADGAVVILDDATSPPLTAKVGRGRPEGRVDVAAGDLLVLYTDGLVERRRVGIDERLAQLADALRALDGTAPHEVCDAVVTAMIPHGRHDDDVALVCIRIP